MKISRNHIASPYWVALLIAVLITSGSNGAEGSGKVSEFSITTAPMVIKPIPDTQRDEGFEIAVIDISEVFVDPDGDILTYSATSSNTGVVRVSVLGKSLIITEVRVGYVTISVTASDGTQNVKDQFIFRVIDINSPPYVLYPAKDLILNEHFGLHKLNLLNIFFDPEGNPLTFTAECANDEVVTVDVSGNILNINEAGLGSTEITIHANDGQFDAEDKFNLIVNGVDDPPILINPFGSIELSENSGTITYNLNDKFKDPEGEDLIFEAINGNISIVQIGLIDSLLTITAKSIGDVKVYVSASDGNFMITDSLLVSVIPANILGVSYENRSLNSGDTILICNHPGEIDLNVSSSVDYILLNDNKWLFLELRSNNIVSVGFTENLIGYRKGIITIRDVQGNEFELFFIQSEDCSNSNKLVVSNMGINLFPNPASQTLNISFNNDGEEELMLDIFDTSGRLISRELYNIKSTKLLSTDISGLEPGLYIIRICIGVNSIFSEIIKN